MEKSNINICDFHSHILPGADHGSVSVSESISQLKLAKKYGVTRIVATPHFYPHRDGAESFLKRRDAAYNRLLGKLPEEAPRIILGSEVLICNNIQNLPMIEKLCIENTNILLLELPFNDLSDEYVETASKLRDNGFDILLAHADRYYPEYIDKFISVGAFLQLNASALMTFFKQKHLYRWIYEKKVVALGSDIHRLDKRAYKHFFKAVRKIGPRIEYIKQTSDAIWNGKPFKIE